MSAEGRSGPRIVCVSEHYFSPRPSSAENRRTIDVPLPSGTREMVTAAGTFSPGRLDLGTQVLLRAVPPPAPGHILDLGTGWGPLAVEAAVLAPDATVWALDVNERSLALTRENSRGLDNVNPVLAADIPGDVSFSTIWSNPPIKVGKAELHDLLRTWVPRLEVSGTAWLVVARKLGSDSLIPWLQEELGADFVVAKHSSAKGYRVIRVERLA